MTDIHIITDKTEARSLAESCTPAINKIVDLPAESRDILLEISLWASSRNLLNELNLSQRISKLSQLLSGHPSYQALYGSGNHRTAVWSFRFPAREDFIVLSESLPGQKKLVAKERAVHGAIFHNTRGTELYVSADASPEEALQIMKDIHRLLAG